MQLPRDKLRGLRVRDFMATNVLTFRPDMSVREAVHILVEHKYSGAPVVDATGRLVGMLSEKDCLRVAVLAASPAEATVGEHMSKDVESVEPDTDLLDVAEGFMQAPYKRFPVVADGVLVGQISRIDVLQAIDQANGSE